MSAMQWVREVPEVRRQRKDFKSDYELSVRRMRTKGHRELLSLQRQGNRLTASAGDVVAALGDIRNAWSAKDFPEVWRLRVAIGFEVSENDLKREDWFWLNALAADAGLVLDKPSHPWLAAFCGFASHACDAAIDDERVLMEAIEQQFID
jgi:hypothetical protein